MKARMLAVKIDLGEDETRQIGKFGETEGYDGYPELILTSTTYLERYYAGSVRRRSVEESCSGLERIQ